LGFDVVEDDEDPEEVGLPLPELEPDAAGTADEAGEPSVVEEELAAAWNASKVLLALALMAKTIPCSQ
jgi:hypothetical protein